MKWSDALRETREAIDAAWDAAETTGGEVADRVKRGLEGARDRVGRMLDSLNPDNDPDNIQ